ncbi:hypothetical protein FQN60_008006 [Etheostoma spectabile]|uniref:Uncharacterized protein n=1 Tax=Etheostoma spectabile TaxID=54343 RepID=A0A5J5CY18_9PERO|nr:hypothetical protein FQN60_008006 [Etheostoma spectabile]
MRASYLSERREERRGDERRGEERRGEGNLNPLGTDTGWWLVATFLSSEMEEGVSSPSRDTRTKSSLLRVDTESEDTLIFPTEPLSSMAAAVKLSHAAHEWKTLNGLFWAASWALRTPHKGEKDTARHSQRALKLATQSLSTRLTAVTSASQG